jgi:tRNA (Thr-GGU) A37 N-methylase
MTQVRLIRIEGNTLIVTGADMLDETPLLDIKPCIPAFDYGEVDTIGWFESKIPGGAVLADARFG